jgi:hypothetical protein
MGLDIGWGHIEKADKRGERERKAVLIIAGLIFCRLEFSINGWCIEKLKIRGRKNGDSRWDLIED